MKATHKTTLNSFWHNLCSACGSLACNRRSSNCGSCFKRSTKKKIQNPDVKIRKSHACQKRSDHAGRNKVPAKKARDLYSCRSARALRLILWSTTTWAWAAPRFAMLEAWAPQTMLSSDFVPPHFGLPHASRCSKRGHRRRCYQSTSYHLALGCPTLRDVRSVGTADDAISRLRTTSLWAAPRFAMFEAWAPRTMPSSDFSDAKLRSLGFVYQNRSMSA